MKFKFLRITFFTLLLLGTTHATVVQAQTGGGEGAPAQSPVQVIVQIVLTGIVLKVLAHFDLP